MLTTVSINGKTTRVRSITRVDAVDRAIQKLYGKGYFFQRDIGIRHAVAGVICYTRGGHSYGVEKVHIHVDGIASTSDDYPAPFVMAGGTPCAV